MIIYTVGLLEKSGKILLLLRQNSATYNGYYGLPGGKIGANESVAQALIREINEETGVHLTQKNLNFVHSLSYKNDQGLEHLSLAFKIINWHGEPVNKETEKHASMDWFYPNNLPNNLGPRHRQTVEMAYNNILYSEYGW